MKQITTKQEQKQLEEENRILRMENENYKRGMRIIYQWASGCYPYSELSLSEIQSMIERVADMQVVRRVFVPK